MLQTKTYKVSMHCPSCEMLLEGMEDLDGVEKVHADYKSGKLVVSFDDAVIDEETVLNAVRKEDYEITKTD